MSCGEETARLDDRDDATVPPWLRPNPLEVCDRYAVDAGTSDLLEASIGRKLAHGQAGPQLTRTNCDSLTRMRTPLVKRQTTPVSGLFSFFSAFQGLAQSTVGRVF